MDLVLGDLRAPSNGPAAGPPRTAPSCRHRGRAGFSLVEVLVAALILLLILLGVVPMFLRAMVHRESGRESTAVGSFARSRAERLVELPFGHRELTVPSGSDTLEVIEYLLPKSQDWQRDPSLADRALWVRTTRVQQFRAEDLIDGDSDGDGDDLDLPLDGGTHPRFVHLKQIEVRIESPRDAGPLGAAEELVVRVLKGF